MPAVAPEIVFLVILFSVFALYIALLAATKGYQYSLGAVLRSLATLLNIGSVLGISINLGKPLEALDHKIQAGLASGLAGLETVMGKFWHGAAALAEATYETLHYHALATLHAIHALTHGTIPAVVNGATRPLVRGYGQVRAQLVAVERTLTHDLTKRARALEAEIERDFGKAWRGIDAVPGKIHAAVAHVFGVIEAQVAELNRYTRHTLNRRLSRLEKLVGIGALTAIGIAALTRVFPYWKCSNVRRFNRQLCRSPFGSLDMLFGLAALSTLLVDPKEVVAIGEDVERALVPGIEWMAAVSTRSFVEAEAAVADELGKLIGL